MRLGGERMVRICVRGLLALLVALVGTMMAIVLIGVANCAAAQAAAAEPFGITKFTMQKTKAGKSGWRVK